MLGNSSIVSEHLPMDDIPSVTLPSGQKRVKRVAYLAEVRNRALRPLNRNSSLSGIKFDKLLFINDVIFDPLDAAQLLFSTNLDPVTGLARYRAACAVDFVRPFKFYDTFATRDLEGYSMGLPLFPWFANVGQAESRKDVLKGTDAVRVKSCWGGMVAFEAKWFQGLDEEGESDSRGDGGNSIMEFGDGNEGKTNGFALRFRSESDLFWDSSECCLVNADLQHLSPHLGSPSSLETGIYMNPFIRVAYSPSAFASLGVLTRRFERALEPLQRLINVVAGLPRFNPRRAEVEGDEVTERVWVYKDEKGWEEGGGGSFQEIKRKAGRGGFCGIRMLLVMKENPGKGEKRWEKLPIPPS
jgi:Cryptococcal mannosyltransferase 1